MDTKSAVPGKRFTIGDLARRTGCSIDTIRYYERIDLMPKVERTEGGHRLYDSVHIQRLAFIRRIRMLGLGLDQVRQILGGIERNVYSCEEVRTLLIRCAAEVRNRIDELQKIERNLRAMVEGCGDAQLANCRVIESMLAGEDAMFNSRCCPDGPGLC